MQKIVVVGTSGAGKSTFAKALAAKLELPSFEMDAFYWGPGWKERPAGEFRARIDEITARGAWVLEGNYQGVRDLVWSRADTLIWLDYSFPVVFSRVLRRTVRRALTREELFAGNRESWRMSFFSRESILLWVLQTYGRRRREFPQLLAEARFAHLSVVRLTSPRAARRALAALESGV